MSLNFSDLPKPELRTPKQWVTFYLRVEAAVAAGQEIKFGDVTYNLDSLESVRKARREWERRLLSQSQKNRKSFGGMRFVTADLSK